MADDVLSQAEVESLLSAIDSKFASGPTEAKPAGTGTPAAPPKRSPFNPRSREKVTPYDFKRPERVGKEQMRALQSLHEGFGRNFGASLSAMLRTIVEVKLTGVDQLTYSEFVFSLENPTCFNLLNAEPLEGSLILDVSTSILYPIIDRLLGGGKGQSNVARRPLTEIELRLVGRITSLFLAEMKKAWENVLTLQLRVDRVESNPQLVQVVPPNEVVVLISFELVIGEIRGMINLCIPYTSIERISNKLTANTWVGYSKATASAESIGHISRQLNGAQVELAVTLAKTRITTQDLLSLRVGDIITTDTDKQSPIEVAIEGVPKFLASPGAMKGHKAVQITSPASPPETGTKPAGR